MSINYKLNKKQFEFFTATKQQVALTSGVGGGKSFVLYLSFIYNEVLKYKKGLHCIGALSHSQLKDVSVPYIKMFLEELNIGYKYNKSDKTIILSNPEATTIHFRSQEMADRVRSIEYSSLYIEEMSYWNEDAFKTFLGRLRNKNGSLNFRTVATPNGKNHFYNFFVENRNDKKDIIYTSTYDNTHLPDGYIDMLLSSYDANMRRQEIDGAFFEASSNQVYYNFNAETHVKECSFQVMCIGMDFNVNPMTAVLCSVQDDKIYIVDEVYLENSNTYEMRDVLKERFGSIKMQIAADSTANSRRSSSTKTDHQILKEEGFDVVRFRNPNVGDRYNCVNNLLEKNRIFIHPRCTYLIRDLEKFYRDNRVANLSHISDALGYVCWHFFPLKKMQHSSHHNL